MNLLIIDHYPHNPGLAFGLLAHQENACDVRMSEYQNRIYSASAEMSISVLVRLTEEVIDRYSEDLAPKYVAKKYNLQIALDALRKADA